MTYSRRDCLKTGIGATLAGVAAGCGPLASRVAERQTRAKPKPVAVSHSQEVRLLNRAGFGPSPADFERVTKEGFESTVNRLLEAKEDEPLALNLQLSRLDVLQLHPTELLDFPEDEVMRQLQQAAILRAAMGANPLFERISDFWSNHFNIYGRKGYASIRKGKEETEVVRQNALGKFPDMLKASAHSPAMLAYLDNSSSRNGNPNENYARELMELHSLGVDGGYNHHDIREVARCFTGWTIEKRFLKPRETFRFNEDLHDKGEKVVLGHRIPAGGGIEDGEQVLDLLANHPSAARFIAGKLCRYILGSSGGKWIEPTAKTYLATGGDIRQMLKPLLLSKELHESEPILKRPFDYVVSALRATGATTDGGKPLLRWLENMGQASYEWPMPDGYPDRNSAWTGSMLSRWNFAFALASDSIGGTRISKEIVESPLKDRASMLFCRPIVADDGKLLAAMANLDERGQAAALIASPEFQWR